MISACGRGSQWLSATKLLEEVATGEISLGRLVFFFLFFFLGCFVSQPKN